MSGAVAGRTGPSSGFPKGGGELGALMRERDWSGSPLGPPSAWSQALRTTVGMLLAAQAQIVLFWGEEFCALYNDAYAPSIGDKHPRALGHPAAENWAELWDDLEPLLSGVRETGETFSAKDRPFYIERHGYGETVYFDISYSAVPEADGLVGGVLCIVSETTARVLAERRQAFLLHLEETLRTTNDAEVAKDAAAGLLGRELGAGRVHYLDVDEATHEVRVRREYRTDGMPSAIGVYRLADLGPVFDAFRTGEPFVVEDHRSDPRTACLALDSKVAATQTRGVLDIPLLRGGKIVGVLAVHNPEPRRWTEHEVGLARATAERTLAAVERAQAEAALRDSEARLRAVIEAAPVGLVFADASGRVTGGNARIEQIFGHPVLPSASVDEYGEWVAFHPDGRRVEGREYPLARALAGEPMPQLEIRCQRGDGSLAWMRHIASAVCDPDGVLLGGVVASLDIDRERRAEDALLRLNAKLAAQAATATAQRDRVWRNSRDLLAVVGMDGVFRAANPAWTVILGHAPEEVVGHSVLDFIWPEDAGLAQASLDAAAKRDLTGFENRYRHEDGTPRWISWNTSVEDDLVYAYGRDITAEKEQAEALARTEEQLRQSQKMEAVGQLTGGLAHDFNNLLQGITGSLELMQARVAQGRIGELDRYVAAAQGAAKRATGLTHRLLAFSRRQTLDPKPISVNALVTGMEELVRRTVGPAITVEVVAAVGLWTSLIDPGQLENALLNLCINARDAMPDGGRLTIETGNRWLDARTARERDLLPGQYVSLCVTDTGTGMTSDVIARAFDPFYTTKPIGMGTGLGLSMVYGFVRQSGGQARICSELGQGTTMCLYLPRHDGAAEGGDVDAAAGSSAEASRAAQGRTVLVVDDEPTVRMLVAEVLEELGITAVEAADGVAAQRVLRSDAKLDLLITDVGLPGGMNGRQVADAGREARPGLKVLFITGYAENAVVGNGHLEPGMQVLTKPFAMEVLASRIRAIVDTA